MRVSSSLALLLVLGCGGSPSASVSSPVAASAGALPDGAASPAREGPPVAVLREVVLTYHGTSVSYPYEWLEGRDDAVRAWSRGQNEYARRVLDAVPGRAAITARVRDLITASPDW